jgi:membrane protease YdiL (CAAX protease family)
LATIVVGLLLFVQPRRGKRRYERLKVDVLVDPTARLRFYQRSIVAAWIMAGIVVLIGLLARQGGHDVGLPQPSSTEASQLGWMVTIEALVLIPLTALVMRSTKPGVQRFIRRQIGHLWAILPVSREERTRFVGVAVTAGICEEVVYRWFGILYVRWLFPDSSNLTVIVVIGVAFGLAHYYQGRWGVLVTGLAGAAFTSLTLSTGSLVPAMIIHALIDLRIVALRAVPIPGAEAGPDPGLAHLPPPPA